MLNYKIKILHLIPELNLTCGMSKMIFEISKDLSNEFDFYIICLKGDAYSYFQSSNIRVKCLKLSNSNPLSIIYIFFYLIYFCKKNKINIIHSHHRFFDLLSFFISKIIKVKTVTTVHSYVKGKQLLSYKANKLIAVSKFLKNHLIDYFHINPDKIDLIYNFVNPEKFKIKESIEKIKLRYEIPQNKFVFVFIGRFHFEKGVDILLQAFYQFQKSRDNTFLLLVGSGEEKHKILDFITKNQLNAKVLEPISQIEQIFAIADLIVLPSRIDPFPLVILECGIMKKPIIASAVGGIPEIIEDGETGLLVISNNVHDLFNELKLLFFDRNLREYLAENLYNKVKKEFLSNINIPKISNFYYSLMKTNHDI